MATHAVMSLARRVHLARSGIRASSNKPGIGSCGRTCSLATISIQPSRHTPSSAISLEKYSKKSNIPPELKAIADLWILQPVVPKKSELLTEHLHLRPQQRVSADNRTWRWNQKLRWHSKDAASMRATLEAMLDSKAKPDALTLGTALSAPLSAEESEKLFIQLTSAGVVPDICSYTILLERLLKARAEARVAHYRQQMTAAGVKPDLLFFNTLLLAAPTIRAAESLRTEMSAAAVTPDVTTFNALFRLCRQTRELARVAGQMLSAQVRPDQHTATVLVKRLATFELAAGLWLLRTLPPAPPAEAYNALLQQFARRGRLQDSVRLFREMRAHVQPDRYAFNALLEAHVNVLQFMPKSDPVFRRTLQWVPRVLDDMQQQRISPDTVTCLLLVRAYLASGSQDQLRQLYEDMRAGARLPKPQLPHFTLLLRHAPSAEAALGYWADMRSQGLRPNAITYGALLWAFASAHRGDLVREHWAALRQANVPVSGELMATLLRAFKTPSASDVAWCVEQVAACGFANDADLSRLLAQLQSRLRAPESKSSQSDPPTDLVNSVPTDNALAAQ